MRKTVVLLTLFAAYAHSQISFESSGWEALKQKALKENRLIFIDAYTTWCGPCKWMEKNVFTDKEVGKEYNSKFINAKFDMESGEGVMLGKLYDVGCYPTYLFIDGNGKVVHRAVGQRSKEEFRFEAITALTPGVNFSAMQQRYEGGERGSSFVAEYIRTLTFNCMNAGTVAATYLSELKDEELLAPASWVIFFENIHDPRSEPFVHFMSNRPAYSKAFGDSAVNQKIFDVYANLARGYIYRSDGPDEARLAELEKELAAVEFQRKQELSLVIANHRSEALRNWGAYFETGKSLIEQYRTLDSDFMNNIAYTVFMHSSNKEHLLEAESWAKRSIELDEGYANLDTYACLLNRNGKKDQAIVTQKKAIAKARAQGIDTRDLEKTLKEIQSGKG